MPPIVLGARAESSRSNQLGPRLQEDVRVETGLEKDRGRGKQQQGKGKGLKRDHGGKVKGDVGTANHFKRALKAGVLQISTAEK